MSIRLGPPLERYRTEGAARRVIYAPIKLRSSYPGILTSDVSVPGFTTLSRQLVRLGPRQFGKTTLARRIAGRKKAKAVYLDLERSTDLRRLDDADAYLRAQTGKLVVIDEIHRAPALFETLRGVSTIAGPRETGSGTSSCSVPRRSI